MEASNVKAMREALEKAQRVLHCAIVADILKGEDAIKAFNAVTAALSAPPRNCDLYRTKKELDAAYEKYREYVIMSNSNPFVAKDEMMTKEDWLFAEAKGEAK